MTTATSRLGYDALAPPAVLGETMIFYALSSHKWSSDDGKRKMTPTAPHGDAEIDSDRLMDRVAADDDCLAFDALCARWGGEIFTYFLRQTREPGPSADLTQITFQKVWRGRTHWPPFRAQGGSFRPWLYTIAKHELVNRSREENKNPAKPGAQDPSISLGPIAEMGATIEKILIDNEIRRRIRACMGRLSTVEIAVLKARFFEDKTLEQIGAERWPEDLRETAITRARRILIKALHKMKRYLAAEGIDSVVEMTSSEEAEVEDEEVSEWLIN